jgi:uncharacterized protein
VTVRDTAWPAGTPCWVDLMVPDAAKAKAFYGALFGWEFRDQGPESGNYNLCFVDGRQAAGLGQSDPEEGIPAVWTTYLATEDVTATLAAATAAGGKVIAEPMEVMTQGTMALLADPTGAVFGLWQAAEHTGAQIANVPGSFTWNENLSRDFPAAKEFYGAVFGYGFDDMSADGFTYAVLTVGGEPVGGIGELPDGVPVEVPANWSTYFQVADVDATVGTIRELGGTVLSEPQDTAWGRMSQVLDNQGAPFIVITPPQPS